MKRPAAFTLAAAAIAALAGCTTPFSHASGPASTQKTAAAAKPTATATGTATPAATATKPAATAEQGTSAKQGTFASQKASTTDKTSTVTACPGQEAWSLRAAATMKALYADTGALAADASASNQAGISKAGRKLASDSLAAATLPLPPADPTSWKALTAAYVAAGTSLAGGDATDAVPQLETGNSAIATFSSAVAKCLAATG